MKINQSILVKMFCVIIIQFFILKMSYAQNLVSASNVTIKSVTFYPEIYNGAVLINLSTELAGCGAGIWFDNVNDVTSNKGKTFLSIVLAAKHSASPVLIYGDLDRTTLAYTSIPACYLYMIRSM